MYEQPNQHKTSRIVSTLITIVVIAFVAFILWWLYQNFFATPSKPNTNATTQPSATNMSDKDFTAKVESAVRELGYDDKYVKLNTANWATTPQQGNILISGSVSSQSVTANSFEGGSFNGTSFSGNGSNLTNLNATNLNSGIISTNLLPGSGSITCPSGVGNLTGGGNQATLGGAVCGAISTITNPTFSQVTSTTIDTNNLNTTSLTTTTLTTNNLSAQTIATSNLNANTITGTNLNITNISSTGNITAVSFAGDGSNLTDLNANNITSGTLAVSQGGTGTNSFTLNGVLYGNGTSSLQSTLASTGPNQCLITLTAGGAPTWGSCASGGGVTTAGGTNNTIAMFNSSGTIANSLLTQDVGATTVTTTGNANITGTATANAFSGNGSGLTNLNATNIASGTIDDARLSNNVALLNNTQTLTGAKTFSALLTATNGLSVTGTMVGTSTIQGTQLISTIATGTAPLQVASTTQIANLNADLLDGYTASDFAQASALGNYVLKAGDTMSGDLNMGTNELIGGTGITDILKLQGTTGNGTAASAAIQLLTGNNGATTALTVLNNGNVGIGTTTPQARLDVLGGVASGLNDALWLSGGAAEYNSGPRMVFHQQFGVNNSYPNWRLGEIGSIYPTGATYAGALVFNINKGATVTDIVEGMRLTYNSRLGINETAPGAQLQVTSGAATTVGQIIKGAASQTADLLQLQNSSGTVLSKFTSAGNLLLPGGSSGTPSLSFTSDPSSGFYSIAPNYFGVSVAGSLVTTYQNNAGIKGTLLYGNTYSGTVANAVLTLSTDSSILATHSIDQTNKKYLIQPYESGVSYNVDTILNSLGGNVGIGTTSPSEKLEISGTVKATGYKSSDGSAGVSGSFTTTDGKTITIKDGLVVSIV